jgi:hypothetical protein
MRRPDDDPTVQDVIDAINTATGGNTTQKK